MVWTKEAKNASFFGVSFYIYLIKKISVGTKMNNRIINRLKVNKKRLLRLYKIVKKRYWYRNDWFYFIRNVKNYI